MNSFRLLVFMTPKKALQIIKCIFNRYYRLQCQCDAHVWDWCIGCVSLLARIWYLSSTLTLHKCLSCSENWFYFLSFLLSSSDFSTSMSSFSSWASYVSTPRCEVGLKSLFVYFCFTYSCESL